MSLIIQRNLLKSFLILLRTFFGKIIHKVEVNYNFNNSTVDLLITITNIKYFWTVILILNKSILFNYNQLNDITAIDNLNLLSEVRDTEKNRFDLVYVFTNIKNNSRLILKMNINKNQRVPSLSNLFKCANWLEREIYDLFGIIFLDHPDLRRILTDYGFSNHPLLKDFPLTVI